MSIVSTLIDKARQRSGITSDSALAAQFGVHRQAVSKWRNGDAYPDEEHIAEMAVMAGDDPVQWLVAIKAIRADGKAGKAWAALAQRLTAVGMALALGVGFPLPRDAQAATGHSATDSIYIMRKRGAYGGVASSGILSRFDCNSNLTKGPPPQRASYSDRLTKDDVCLWSHL